MGISLLKKLLARDLSPFFDFEDTSSQIKFLIFICGERSCNANFKMGSAISVHREEGKKLAIQARQKIMPLTGFEPPITRSEVRRSNHSATR